MRILKKDLRNNLLKLLPESTNDLWVLEKIITPGDRVFGKTQRNIQIEKRGRKIKKGRKTVFVKLEVESSDFNEQGNQLRLKGIILESSEEISKGYHTFEIEPNKKVSIKRNWSRYELEQIENAKIKHPLILIAVLDESECSFAFLKERLKILTTFRGPTGKSYGIVSKKNYVQKIISFIEEKDFDHFVLAGPGFMKDKIKTSLRDKPCSKKMHVYSIAHTGEVGIREVIRTGIINNITKKSQISQQTILVEKFFQELSKGDDVVYGKEETKKAMNMGAVKMVLVSSSVVNKNQDFLKKSEKMGAKVRIIDNGHEAGQRFEKFEIGGFLRFKI